jgi:hypothetical protein
MQRTLAATLLLPEYLDGQAGPTFRTTTTGGVSTGGNVANLRSSWLTRLGSGRSS